jgi:hypothetical protein
LTVVAADPIELLDRQHQRLQEMTGAAFVQELKRFHDFITGGPADVVAALATLRAAAAASEAAFVEHDRELVPELVELRNDLVARVPEADDSAVPRPAVRGIPAMEWMFGLANFDEVAAGGPERSIQRDGYDQSASGMLARILEHKLRDLQWAETTSDGITRPSEVNLRPDLDDLALRLRNLNDRHRHAAQAFSQAVETTGGFQVQLLDMAVEQMNPPPREVETEADREAWFNETFMRVAAGWHVIEDASAGRAVVGEHGRLYLEVHEDKLKPAAEKVHEALRMQLATAPAPTPSYGQRMQRWVGSAGYGLTGGPCIAGVLSGALTGQAAGFGGFIVLGVVFALVPPFIAQLPVLPYTRRYTVSAVLAAVLCAAVLVGFGAWVALAAFLLLAVGFVLGQWVSVE